MEKVEGRQCIGAKSIGSRQKNETDSTKKENHLRDREGNRL